MGSELVPVGRVGKPHGLDGGFFVEGASERPEVFATGATLQVDGEAATVVASRHGSGGRTVIRLDRHVGGHGVGGSIRHEPSGMTWLSGLGVFRPPSHHTSSPTWRT